MWLFVLSAVTYFLQGIEGLPGLALTLHLKENVGLLDFELQRLMSWVTLAWLVKPLWGYLVDTYWNKSTWVVISLLVGMLFATALGSLTIGLLPLIILMAGLNLTMAVRDVAVDGMACVAGKRDGTTGKFQSIQWGAITLAGIVATLGGGIIASISSYQTGFLLLLPLFFGALCIVYKAQGNDGSSKTCKISFTDYKKLFSKKFLFVALFLWIYKTAPAFGTPLFYMKRDVFGWSAMMIAYIDAIVLGLELIGAWLYSKYCKVWPIKKMLFWSIIIGVVTTPLYLYYTPFTAILYGLLFGTIGMIFFLVCMDFMARESLTGLEATSFALLCSVSNFSSWCSLQLGSYSLEWLGLAPTIWINAGFGLLALPLLHYLKFDSKEKI